MRLASFNVENLFSRAKAFDAEDGAAARRALDAFARFNALIAKPTSGPSANGWKDGGYIEKLPKDPWGNAYQYLSPGVKGEIDVFSYGADGQPGGTGEDADVGSWH